MGRLHSKDLSTVSVDDSGGTPVDMKPQTISIGFGVGADTHDVTVVGDAWKSEVAGLKGGDEFAHEVFYTNDNTGTRQTYAARLGISGTFSFGDGTRSVSMETIVTKYSEPIKVGDMVKITASHKINGSVTFS